MKTTLAFLLSMFLTTTVQAAVKGERMDYSQGDTDLYGYVAYDDEFEGERPGVLIVHQWWGLNRHARRSAEALAREGYIALALDMFGEGKTTDHPREAGGWTRALSEDVDMRNERFNAAYEALRKHPLTEQGKIAAIGYCFGGGVVLTMAKGGADLRGVVSFHGSLPTAPIEPGAVKARILVCHGAEDPLVTDEQVAEFQRVMSEAGADWQFITYSGARHAFTDKASDMRGIPALGYNESAERRSWAAMLSFFDEIFSD